MIHPDAEGAAHVWHGRAIQHRPRYDSWTRKMVPGYVDFVPDRGGYDKEPSPEFQAWVRDKVVPWMKEVGPHMEHDRQDIRELRDDEHGRRAVISTCGSYGYIYYCAWQQEEHEHDATAA